MSLILQELGIVVAMQQPNPNLVTGEFLKLSGIIPSDWQLAREPINNERVSQLLFTNGVSIVAEPNRIMFGEIIGERDINTLTIATIAQKYLDIFKLAQYSAIGINIRSYSPQSSPLAATQYINHQLLADGSWQNYGTAPVQAALKLVYTLAGRQLNLEVAAAGMQFSEAEVTPVVLFSGNFSYNLATPSDRDNLAAVSQVLAQWQTDLSAYCELITDRFLNPTKPTISMPASSTLTAVGADDGLDGLEIPYAPNLFPVVALT
jgi:hypothetical protein